MKKIFTLALLVITYSVSAQTNAGKMSITNLSNQRIVVEVDGKKFTDRINNNDNIVLVPSLPTGYHQVKVYTLPMDRNNNTAMGIRKQTLIFQKNVNIRAQYHVDIVINRFGKVLFDELSMNDRNYVDIDNDNWYNNPYDDRNNPRGPRDPHDPRNNPRDPNPRDNDYGYNNRVMNAQSFAAFRDVVVKERFDNSRVTIARQVIDQNFFTADQVKQLLQIFTTDSYKLDLAKYAYKNTVNKQDYFMLYEVFTFSSSKEDLANYIRQYK